MAEKQWRVETDEQRNQRLKYLLFNGVPMPSGWKMPRWSERPATSNPADVQRAEQEVAALNAAKFESWKSVPSDMPGDVFVPGMSGSWNDLTERGKLDVMQHWVDWQGVSQQDRARVIMKEVNLSRLSEDIRERIQADAGQTYQRTEKSVKAMQRSGARRQPEAGESKGKGK